MADFVFNVCMTGGQIASTYSFFWQDWRVNVALAVLISSGILSLIFMASKFFRNQQLEVWSRAELVQLLVTAAIAVVAVGTVGLMCELKPSKMGLIFGERYNDARFQNMNFYDLTYDYLGYIRKKNLQALVYVGAVYWVFQTMAGVHHNAIPLGMGFSLRPAAGLNILIQIFSIVAQGIATSLLFVIMQIKILEYLSIATLTYLFPIGVLLRAFEPTRLFGGSLIAFSFGVFLIYPAMLVINDFIIRGSQTGIFERLDEPQTSQEYRGIWEEVEGGRIAQGNYGEAENLSRDGYQGININRYSGSISIKLFYIVSLAFYIFIASVFLPAINFAVFIPFIRDFTMLLGEEMDLSTILRMI